MKIKNKGINNTVNIAESVYLRKKSKIKISGNYNSLLIEDGTYNNLEIRIEGDDNSVKILSSEGINNLKIIVQNNSNHVHLDRNLHIAQCLIVSCGKSNYITIGEGCMLSTNIEIWGCDGHSILEDNKIINLSKSISIGKNVWIGGNVKILKGVNIPEGCVVGANSLITSKLFLPNSIIVGSPAKTIKENIRWSRENLEF